MDEMVMKISFDDFAEQFDPSLCDGNYGGRMMLSSLADWVEWAALVSVASPWPTTVDAIGDALGRDWYQSKLTGDQFSDTLPIPLSDALRNVIEERARVLGRRYPFRFDDRGRLQLRADHDIERSAYVVLLQIALLKSWAGSDDAAFQACTKLLEHVVAGAFRQTGCDSAIVGTSVGGGFEAKLQKIADELAMRVDPSSAAHSKAAKDERVDVVAGRFFRDGRRGEVFILVQVTCAKNERWESKLSCIPLSRWRNYFLEQFPPIGFLAVPYHVLDEDAALLTSLDGGRSFLDRTRLVLMLNGEIASLDAVGCDLLKQVRLFSSQHLKMFLK